MNAPDRQNFRLVHATARAGALAAVRAAPDFYLVTVRPPSRSLDQNAHLHASLTDIADQVTWHGKKFPMEVWKRLCVAAWLRETGGSPELIPALDGHGVDIIYERTSKMSVAQVSELLEWCFAFGAQNGVKFKQKEAA